MKKTCGVWAQHFLNKPNERRDQPECEAVPSRNRFAEWSHAAWDMQRERLEEPSSKLDVRFISVYHDDSNDMASHTELIRGKIMRDWWDGSDQAGAKSRSSATFGESLKALDCLAVINGDVKKLEVVIINSCMFVSNLFR